MSKFRAYFLLVLFMILSGATMTFLYYISTKSLSPQVKGTDVEVTAFIKMDSLTFKIYPEKRIPPTNNWHTIADVKIVDPVSFAVVAEKSVNVDDSGNGTMLIDNYFPPGPYNIYIKGASHLTKKIPNITLDQIQMTYDFTPNGDLIAGDVSPLKDDFVNSLDISYLVGKLNTNDYVADLNQDTKVNSLDLSSLIYNLGKKGDV